MLWSKKKSLFPAPPHPLDVGRSRPRGEGGGGGSASRHTTRIRRERGRSNFIGGAVRRSETASGGKVHARTCQGSADDDMHRNAA